MGSGKKIRTSLPGNDHLTSDERELAVVNPDHISTDESDSIASPDVLRVQILIDVSPPFPLRNLQSTAILTVI